ncbi:hypothetical protein [Erythrobacter sp. NFXS35]
MKTLIATIALFTIAACTPTETGGGEETHPDCAPGAEFCAD